MRGKKKKGTMIKPSAEEAVTTALMEKLKDSNSRAAKQTGVENMDTKSMTQSEYTYYSETTNEDTNASKLDGNKGLQNEDVSVDMKDINIEASLEPHEENKSARLVKNKQASDKRHVTPIATKRGVTSELAKDVKESKVSADRVNTVEHDNDSADLGDDDEVESGTAKIPVSAEKLGLNKLNDSPVKSNNDSAKL